MMKGGHTQTSQLHDINWGALDHASHAPYMDMYVCVYEDPLPRNPYHTKHPKPKIVIPYKCIITIASAYSICTLRAENKLVYELELSRAHTLHTACKS